MLDFEEPFLIAEIGGNHEGNLEYAKRLLLQAADCGANAVKFQTYFPDKIVSKVEDPKRHSHFGKFSLPIENYFELSDKDLKIPFHNNYKTKTSLGQDRIGLVSAAYFKLPSENTLVVDMGTCITYDFIDSKNIYHGGAISPGINMRYKSLSEFTSNLPLLEFNDENKIIGSTTDESIHIGVLTGIIGEINEYINRLEEKYLKLNIIITGGDSTFLLNKIKNAIFADQDFLAIGLYNILKYNEGR